MKNITLLSLCIMLAACSKQTIKTEEDNQKNDLPINISVRSSDTGTDDEYYPINVFIFNEKGEYISRQEVSKEKKTFSTKLKAGNYSISAFSGLDNSEYSYPESPVYDDVIEMKNSYSLNNALMSGHKDIELTETSDITVPIKYCVSSLSFSFSEVPEDATGVSLSISPLSNGYTFSGNYSGNAPQREIGCTKKDELWEAGPVYVFPSENSEIALAVTVDTESGTETYNYTYRNSLQPSVPYNFKGKYNGGITVNVGFDIEGWKPGIDVSYDIVPDETTDEEDTGENPDTGESTSTEDTAAPEETDIPTVYSDDLPEPNSIWKSFYVWTTEEISSTEIEALIIAPMQWPDILPEDAQANLDWYEEDGITGWRTFTEEETIAFRRVFACGIYEFNELNDLLSSNGHDIFYCSGEERYLCINAEYSFNIDGKLIIRSAGAKTEYYLRPVKTIRIKLSSTSPSL